MSVRKIVPAVLLLALCLALSGCRTRTGPAGQAMPDPSLAGFLPGGAEGVPEEQEQNGEPGGQTKENPEASRKEYDGTRPAEILPGTERFVHESGEGTGFPEPAEDAGRAVSKVNGDAERTASRTVAAGEAERMGVSEDGEDADSAMTYYSVLLRDRVDSLFECQRLYVYWETAEDRVTVFKASPEHSMILDAGAYDVSARLLEGNLRVDDGWIGRKNPDLVVKVARRGVLGTGIASAETARKACEGLLARDGWAAMNAVRNGRVLLLSEELLEAPHLRLAAELMIAKAAYPDLMADVEIGRALAALGEEAAGSAPDGTYYYAMGGL